jgi:hypothetical protein
MVGAVHGVIFLTMSLPTSQRQANIQTVKLPAIPEDINSSQR